MQQRPSSTYSDTLRSRLKLATSDELTVRPMVSTRSDNRWGLLRPKEDQLTVDDENPKVNQSLDLKQNIPDGIKAQKRQGKMLVSLVQKKILEDLEIEDTQKSIINSQAYTEKHNHLHLKQEVQKLKKDVEILKEMLRTEKLKNSEL